MQDKKKNREENNWQFEDGEINLRVSTDPKVTLLGQKFLSDYMRSLCRNCEMQWLVPKNNFWDRVNFSPFCNFPLTSGERWEKKRRQQVKGKQAGKRGETFHCFYILLLSCWMLTQGLQKELFVLEILLYFG